MRTLELFGVVATIGVATMLATPAGAQAYFGYGTRTCGAWTQERHGSGEGSLAYSAWLLGFVSGANVNGYLISHQSDFLASTDAPGIIAFVDKYCSEHPLNKLMDGAIALIGALRNGEPQVKTTNPK
jgi:hypothetical protein